MQSRRPQRSLPQRAQPRPNELSDMGRINAMPQAPTVGAGTPGSRSQRRTMSPNVAPTARTTRGVAPSQAGARSRVFPRAALALVGGMIWFGATTASELIAGGDEFDLWLFVGTLVVTAIIGALAGRSWGDDVALGIGAVIGMALSGLLIVSRPEGQTPGDLVELAVVLVTLIVLLAGVFRSIVGRLRRT